MLLPSARWSLFARQYSFMEMKKGTLPFPSIVFCHRKVKGNAVYNPNPKRL
jgi:hypothetical protein